MDSLVSVHKDKNMNSLRMINRTNFDRLPIQTLARIALVVINFNDSGNAHLANEYIERVTAMYIGRYPTCGLDITDTLARYYKRD